MSEDEKPLWNAADPEDTAVARANAALMLIPRQSMDFGEWLDAWRALPAPSRVTAADDVRQTALAAAIEMAEAEQRRRDALPNRAARFDVCSNALAMLAGLCAALAQEADAHDDTAPSLGYAYAATPAPHDGGAQGGEGS